MRMQCPRGHELTDDNIYIAKRDGIRRCRTCRRINDQNYRTRRNINGDGPRIERSVTYLNSRGVVETTASRPTSELIEEAQLRAMAPRSLTAEFFGDPGEGYSQLDRKLREESSILDRRQSA